MLSLAAIVAWPFMENITSQQHLFGTEKDVHNGSSILHYKRGRSCSSFSIIKKKKQNKKKNILCTDISQESGVSPQQGVRQAVVAAAAAAQLCSMLLIVLLVDSSFRCFVVYLQVREKRLHQELLHIQLAKVLYSKSDLKEQYTQIWIFSHYVLSLLSMESWLKFHNLPR